MDLSNSKCVVIHNGTSTTIAGFSNSEIPKCIIPSSYLKKKDGSFVFGTFDMMDSLEDEGAESDIFTIVDSQLGVPYNWEALEKQWEYIFEKQLKCDPTELPVLITIPSSISKNEDIENKVIEQYCKIAFEKFKIPYLQIVNESLSISLGLGKKTSLVIDISGSGSSVTPIVDGVIIKNGIVKSKYGGDFLDYQIIKKFSTIDEDLEEEMTNSSNIWVSSNSWIKNFKKTMLQVTDKKLQDVEKYYEEQLRLQAELQNQGSITSVGTNPLSVKKEYLYRSRKTVTFESRELYQFGEYLFQPQLASEQYNRDDGLGELIYRSITSAAMGNMPAAVAASNNIGGSSGATGGDSNVHTPSNVDSMGVGSGTSLGTSMGANGGSANSGNAQLPPQLATTANVTENISNLLNNIIIKGGTSLVEGIETRIINEISMRFPQYKITTFANQVYLDRMIQSWTSGTTMGKLGEVALGNNNKWYCREIYESSKNEVTA
ncbi:hypothetical protein Kpol_520p11 [Vanderwaltozyma polyspora DSM 70294]|uniref:Uncharacterized protein n=1 Tax=Vanderwaltozyma polyspora (strain ATCC 22028 / DSM 70294 / BCRC 21397 / CBS 2163 / NBRC 10782 / NRRL Y-8283 / UCD 57-17) TaxID=436907 RepID=A7TM96_VANPO|nr:uncharacterized protein Kpol_520p11 [Vanderwaltozyma polyspora DSM 70294]EDO16590.1 hypothetical protein Kpol_520p11 [Vanderwaltozyma polyspora DSM 70294]